MSENPSVASDPERRWGLWVVAMVMPILSAMLSFVLSNNTSERNAERGREARADLQRTQCALITALDDNYHDSPITTEVGRRNARTLSQLRASQGCEPPS